MFIFHSIKKSSIHLRLPMKKCSFLVFSLIILITSCTPSSEDQQSAASPGHQHDHIHRQDVHSYARPQEAVTKHLELDLKIDFEQKILKR